jgi:hypothetical protein
MVNCGPYNSFLLAPPALGSGAAHQRSYIPALNGGVLRAAR